jgi:tetratricopeptide (TPR) repeat protein
VLPALALWVLTTTAASSQPPTLGAAAAASGRPRECASASRRAARKTTVWEMARVPNLARYCDLLSRAQAQLASSPKTARAAAVEAEAAMPGRAAPAVVIARASLALGELDEAQRHFARARAADPRSVEDPSALLDLARVLRKSKKLDDALVAYRALVPRLDLLSTTETKVSVLLEAAHVSMAQEAGAAGEGKARLDEAIAYLREARQRPATQLAGDALLSLVLALDRAGERVQADAALASASRSGVRLQPNADYLATPEDRAALEALAHEADAQSAAMKSWETYLAGPGGRSRYAPAARTRLEALRRGGRVSEPTAKPKKKAKP